MNIKSKKINLNLKNLCFFLGANAAVAWMFPKKIGAAELEPISGVPTKTISDVLSDATSWLVGFAISLCVIALIWGGIYYVGSSGDQEKTQNAKNIMKYALIGIFLVGISYAILSVIDKIFT